ncbi:MAG: Plug domain-containing protein [Candidatus Accumulibacter sp.]|jgi:hemoglobin/transferrin/lactoferrin receptor protein|nr:Plug domain-containing protein [Accumulibacter sp.]
MRKKTLCLSISALLSWASFNANAQDQASAQAAVGGANPQSNPQRRVALMDGITVTATRQTQSVLDVPATVTTITQEEIEDRGVTNIQELIRHEPGVEVNRTTSGTDPFGNFQGFTIRGVGANRVQIQVDGARVIELIQDGNRDFVDGPLEKPSWFWYNSNILNYTKVATDESEKRDQGRSVC